MVCHELYRRRVAVDSSHTETSTPARRTVQAGGATHGRRLRRVCHWLCQLQSDFFRRSTRPNETSRVHWQSQSAHSYGSDRKSVEGVRQPTVTVPRPSEENPAMMPIPRRSFLAASAAAATGASLLAATQAAENIPGFDQTRTDYDRTQQWKPFSDRKVRVGIVGHGVCQFGLAFDLQTHPNVELVAVSDLFPDRCADMARIAKCGKTYPSLEEMVKDDSIEAIYCATGRTRARQACHPLPGARQARGHCGSRLSRRHRRRRTVAGMLPQEPGTGLRHVRDVRLSRRPVRHGATLCRRRLRPHRLFGGRVLPSTLARSTDAGILQGLAEERLPDVVSHPCNGLLRRRDTPAVSRRLLPGHSALRPSQADSQRDWQYFQIGSRPVPHGRRRHIPDDHLLLTGGIPGGRTRSAASTPGSTTRLSAMQPVASVTTKP